MLTYIRYAMATVCFAASVGCLALWWRSTTISDVILAKNALTAQARVGVEVYAGSVRVVLLRPNLRPVSWSHNARLIDNRSRLMFTAAVQRRGRFQGSSSDVRFPLWYPTLIFALAGVAAIRFRRQFSIRSALVATTVVAALIAMAVVL